jgi:hypothetical protein
MKLWLAHAEVVGWALRVIPPLTACDPWKVRVRVLHPVDELRPFLVLSMSSQLPCPSTLRRHPHMVRICLTSCGMSCGVARGTCGCWVHRVVNEQRHQEEALPLPGCSGRCCTTQPCLRW